jgi:predicted DNA binding protein
MVTELRIKVQYDALYLKFSKALEDLNILAYCNIESDVVLIPGELTPERLIKAKEIFSDTSHWKITTFGHPITMTYINTQCHCSEMLGSTLNSLIQQNGGFPIYPIRYVDGWEYHKIMCLDKTDVKSVLALLQKYPSMEILSISELGPEGILHAQMLSISEIASELTDHQLFILLLAFEKGYYEIPRTIRTQDLAETLNVSRPAIEKSLRKAENKIMASFMPFMLYKREQLSEAVLK